MHKENSIVIYHGENGEVGLRADLLEETIWASQAQIAEVFETSIPNVNIHIGNMFIEGELDKSRTIKRSLIVQKEGKKIVRRRIELYGLDMIIAVGYRVNSKKATHQ